MDNYSFGISPPGPQFCCNMVQFSEEVSGNEPKICKIKVIFKKLNGLEALTLTALETLGARCGLSRGPMLKSFSR